MHGRIKAALAESLGDIRVLYGGSVSMTNCASFSKAPEVDGLLVGGASLEAESFWQICASVGENS
jgi:triosephosphate isomerase